MFAVLRSVTQRVAVPAAAVMGSGVAGASLSQRAGVQAAAPVMQIARGLKTSKAAAKRFIVTGSGRVKHGRTGRRHNTGKRPNGTMRGLREMTAVRTSDLRRVKGLLQI